MTREEAITILEGMRIDIPVPKAAVTQRKRNVALDMAISALSCSEIPNSSDLISRQASIDYFVTNIGWHDEDGYSVDDAEEIRRIWTEIFNGLPSAEPQERTGYWIYDGFDHAHGIEWCHCSKCGNRESVDSVYTQVDIYPYCAKCGAKMKTEQILSEADNDTAYGGLMSAT